MIPRGCSQAAEVTEMSIIAAAQQPPMKNWAQDFEAIHSH